MRLRIARNRIHFYIVAAALAAAFSFIPTPFSLILPGRAVDLNGVVSVGNRALPASGRLYLTDVRFATHVAAFQLLGGLLPGACIVRTRSVVPSDITASEYEGVEREAMSESQAIAAAVAEKAAGYRVAPPIARLFILSFARGSRASALRPLDLIVAVSGHPVASTDAMKRVLSKAPAGSVVRVTIMRRGVARTFMVPTLSYRGRRALGVYLTTIYQRPELPVPVTFHLPNISGSSGGLMFALETYRLLRPFALTAARIAGTGTIRFDGSVGPIDGAPQKVIAARGAGATVFLVPKPNYKEVSQTPGIRIVPVGNFAQALRALRQVPRRAAHGRSARRHRAARDR